MYTVHKQGSLNLMFWNCQGIRSKIDELAKFLRSTPCDIVCLCETFLKPNHRIFFSGYTIVRRDRLNGRLGGLVFLLREGLLFDEFACPPTLLIECNGIKVNSENQPLIIINAYLPGGSTHLEINNHFKRDLLALTQFTEAFCVVGDLNSKHTSWNCTMNNAAGNILFDTSITNNFFIEFPPSHTHCPMSIYTSPSTIDIMLTNRRTNISNLETRKVFTSDHIPVLCKISRTIEYSRTTRFNYARADWNCFRNIITKGLDEFIFAPFNSTNDIDQNIKLFENLIHKAQ